ncbi:MAG: hypothetical protein NC406_02445 [Bacteroides sp.]|nr:hypothetical protein [Bacteroides sp.]
MLARYPAEAPATWLFAALSHVWGSVMGWGLLTMRYFAVAWILIMSTAGALYFYSRTRLPRVSIALAGLTALLIAEKTPAFSWHAFTDMMIVLIIIATLWALERPSARRLALVGVMAALAALARMPNVVAVPLLVLVMCIRGSYSGEWRRMWVLTGVMLAACAVTFAAVVTAVFGSPAAYVAAVKGALPTNHAPFELVSVIYTTFIKWSPYWAVVALGAVGAMLGARIWPRPRAAVVISMVVAAYIGLTLADYVFDHYFRLIKYYQLGMLLSALTYILIKARRAGGRDARLQVMAIVLLMTVPVAGSNTGLVRIPAAALYPVAAAVVLPWLSRRACIYAACVAAAMLAYLGVRTLTVSYEDAGALFASQTVGHPRLEGLRTEEERAADIRELIALMPPAGSAERFATAYTSTYYGYLAYYLADVWPSICAHEWRRVAMHTDSAQVAECMDFVATAPRPLRVIFKPDDRLADGADPLRLALEAASPDSVAVTPRYRAYLYR